MCGAKLPSSLALAGIGDGLDSYDYIIIGAGSAGCVLANRLTEDRERTVLLLEAGGSDRHPFVRMPAALSLPMNSPRFNWGFESEPEPGLANRRINCPRGRVLGGSSSINGMVYVRGHPLDFEQWQSGGATGWGYADVLPYFKKAERTVAADARYRGESGPLTISRGNKRNPLYGIFLDACRQAGYQHSDDLNGYQQEGFGDLEMTVHGGSRCSAARAYLQPARPRANLEVITRAQAERVSFTGKRATSVTYRRAGTSHQVTARREIVLCGGAIGSPQLLLLSGVGAHAELAAHGIEQIHELPGVGRNLMDHLEVYLQYACTQPMSLNRWLGFWGKAAIAMQWLALRSGHGSTNHFEVGGFVRSRAGVRWPDVQFHFLPAAVSYDGSRRAAADGFQVHVGPMRSPSRGSVRLRSANPAAAPLIRFNYMSTDDDWQVFRAAIRLAREIFAQPAFDPVRGDEIEPGAGDPSVAGDAVVDEFIRHKAESAYHPCGTCRLGTDEQAVVDIECRVHGLDGIRVVDASVFPTITDGNLNAPTIMLAEKAADAICGRVLAREPMPFHTDPRFEARQRPDQ